MVSARVTAQGGSGSLRVDGGDSSYRPYLGPDPRNVPVYLAASLERRSLRSALHWNGEWSMRHVR